jgi:hypothetical protein
MVTGLDRDMGAIIQLSAFSFQLSAFSFQLSAFSFQLSAFGWQAPASVGKAES